MKKPNIVLITIDCLRGDFVNEENTPNLLRLVDEYNGFITTKAYTAGMATPYAFPAILGGIYPFKYGFRVGAPLHSPTIAEVLKKSGYNTLGFSAGNAYTSSLAKYNRGFEIFNDYMPKIGKEDRSPKSIALKKAIKYAVGEKVYKKLSDLKTDMKKRAKIMAGSYFPVPPARVILSDVEKALEGSTSPFFLWMHLMDVHEPYLATNLSLKQKLRRAKLEPLRSRLWGELIEYLNGHLDVPYDERIEYFVDSMKKVEKYSEFMRELYMLALQETDKSLAAFIETVVKSKEKTIVIITSDHGEEFFDISTYGHFPLFHNPPLVEIPLILLGGENPKPHGVISNADIGPTICSIAEVEKPYNWDGISIFENEDEKRITYTQSMFGCVPTLETLMGRIPFSGVLVSAHDKFVSSSTVNKNASPRGSYKSVKLIGEAMTVANLVAKKQVLISHILERN